MDLSKPLFRLLIPLLLLLALLTATGRLPTGAGATRGTQEVATYAQTLVENADIASGDAFGTAVALSGDLLAVGATGADVDDISGGAVYLFERDGQAPGGWAEVRKLHRDPPHGGGYFGFRAALQGDTLVVSTPADPRNGSFWQGAAYVYERNHGGADAWGFVTQLADEDEADWRRFGHAVALDGDLIAVSAVGAEDDRGKVYLYSRAAGWARVKEFADPGGASWDWFGSSVALDGDTLVIGAQAADLDATNVDTGAAFVYQRDQSGADQWGLVARLGADPARFDSFFGSAVALEGDTLVVAAYNEDRYEGDQEVASQVGAAYVYERNEGGANAWGLVTALRPADGGTLDRFGTSLALAGDDLWVGAPNVNTGGFGGEGVVFHYGRDEGGADAWGLHSTIEADPNSRNAAFGASLAADGLTLVAGAPEHETQGAAYVITESDEPGATITTSFLPAAMYGWVRPTGTLNDGGSLESPAGAIIGAVPGTLTEPLVATIVETDRPAESMPGGFIPRGAYYRLAAEKLTITPADKPLLVGLPVPASTDTDRLAVAAYVPDGLTTESEVPESPTRSWTSLPGRYDEVSNLFVITVRAVLPEGVTLALFEHPENAPLPPPESMAARPAQTDTAEYEVACDPAAQHKDVCTTDYYVQIGDELEAAHDLFVDTLGFKSPALVHSAGVFVGPDKEPMLHEVYFGALIAGAPCVNHAGDAIAGEYRYVELQLLVCIDEGWSTDAIRYTVRHELFHAIQASYPNVARDRMDRRHYELAYWLVEGTAAAAERSSFVLARSIEFDLRKATIPITSSASLHEYEAQDFWIFTGMEGDQSDHYLSYLKEIFDQGATPEHVDLEMDLGEAYWDWAKNQVMEHYQPMLGVFQSGPCELEDAAIDPANINILDYPNEYFVEGELPPLTSALVEIRVAGPTERMPVWGDNNADRNDLRYKVYVDGETGCKDVPDDQRILLNVPAGAKRYVLVANVSLTESFTYAVEVD